MTNFEFSSKDDVYFSIEADNIEDAIQQALNNIYDIWAEELAYNQALTSFDAITRIYDCDNDNDMPSNYAEEFKLSLIYVKSEVRNNKDNLSDTQDWQNEWHQELHKQIATELI